MHELGGVPSAAALAQTAARVGGWPPGVEAFYQSFDGARLFADSFILLPAAELDPKSDGTLHLGTALELELRVDARGHIRELDESGDSIVVGTSVERWLDALMARERLVVDREGEWKEVFSDDGQELLPAVRERRASAGKKCDPGAALFWFESAELRLEEGNLADARTLLQKAVELDPDAPALHTVLAGALVEAGDLDAAGTHYWAAAEHSSAGEVRARRFAQAAELAQRRGDAATKQRAGAAALAAAASAPAKWLSEAEGAFAEADYDTAQHLASLSQAVSPTSGAEALLKRLSVRRSLRVIE